MYLMMSHRACVELTAPLTIMAAFLMVPEIWCPRK
eukprot:CAMPEP_0173417192 /NCGR_PEP_ID=MMETSP1356-20130122/85776_1 /TAXON_ID=77927 ORGANISM="Hemiselmis virescens, Strain PCC157" /NCGR_SAMPLE_ID=MMETSP1356 /ASSEMBLY_ACC=CAM_ASM_000847 /LENGTH=34 /DNA_ID= /DNA_START= /DNA_END= /DNA_ORIENTATION=